MKVKPQIIKCPNCHQRDVPWIPAPDQNDNEDSIGPMIEIPKHWDDERARLSPPDARGRTHLLVTRKPNQAPSYWPVELSCPLCTEKGEYAADAWNTFMGRKL